MINELVSLQKLLPFRLFFVISRDDSITLDHGLGNGQFVAL